MRARPAAVLLAGLLVFDPSLKLMVVTKENVAAHAFAEHLVALRLSQEVQQLMGRLVGYYEQRRKGSGTPLRLKIATTTYERSPCSWTAEVVSCRNVDTIQPSV